MARKYRSSKKYSYNQSAKSKKIVLIVLAVVLVVVAAAVAAFMLLGSGDDNTGKALFTLQTPPEKTTYRVGESPTWYGLQVLLVTDAGSTVVLGPESCKITGFDSSAPAENQVITVKYGEYSTTFTVAIEAENQDADDGNNGGTGNNGSSGNNGNNSNTDNNGSTDTTNKKLVKITFKKLPKTKYNVGDDLSISGGMLLRHYEDGSTEELELSYSMVRDFDAAAPGTYTVTVMYFEGRWVSTTYKITVTK